MKVRMNNVWHEVVIPWVHQEGRWHMCRAVYVRQNDEWHQTWGYMDNIIAFPVREQNYERLHDVRTCAA